MVYAGDGTQAFYIVDPSSVQEIEPETRQETSPYLQLRVPGWAPGPWAEDVGEGPSEAAQGN